MSSNCRHCTRPFITVDVMVVVTVVNTDVVPVVVGVIRSQLWKLPS